MSNLYNTYWKHHKSTDLPDFHYKWPIVSKFIPIGQNIKILDHGCGTGIIMKHVVSMNPQSKFFGIDVSPYAIKTISKKFPAGKFYVVKDGEKLPFKSGSIDFIVSLDVIEHVYNTQNIIAEFHRVLSPKGKIIVSTPYYGLVKNILISFLGFDTVFDPYGPHIRFFTKKSFLQGFKNGGFKVKEFGYFGRFFPISNGMFALFEKGQYKNEIKNYYR